MVFRRTQRPTHLSFQILVYIAIATMISLGTYMLLGRLADVYINSAHPNRNTVQERIDALQTFINRHNVTTDSLDELNQWVKQFPFSLVYIYDQSHLLYTNDIGIETKAYDTVNDASYPLQTFALDVNGTPLRVDIMNYDVIEYLTRVDRVNIGIAFIVFVTTMCILLRSITDYIKTLTDELNAIGGGMLETKVSEKGNDELTNLAQGINLMREALLTNTEMIVRSQEVLKDATTTLSHDIRTPMTILLGYLEYLQIDDTLTVMQREKINLCFQKAQQVKQLTHELLRCFTAVASHEEHSFPIIKTAFSDFKTDFLKQLECTLDVYGIQVRIRDDAGQSGWCYQSQILMQRIFDNITSNIIKYADYEAGVMVVIEERGNRVQITVENQIASQPRQHDSYGIGLRSCERLMSLQEGRLSWNRNATTFLIMLEFPVKNY